jgi:hypothetical protein
MKHLPERLSRRNRNRVLKLSSSYRNPMVKHEPELHRRTLVSKSQADKPQGLEHDDERRLTRG